MQGARVNQTTVGTAIMEAKLAGLRQKLGGTVPVTASVDPYNAAASLSTLNGTEKFGGPTALTIARPPEQIQREEARLPTNAHSVPEMYQPPAQVTHGYVGSGWNNPENTVQMQMNPAMNQMMNPMMMQQMMMQQMAQQQILSGSAHLIPQMTQQQMMQAQQQTQPQSRRGTSRRSGSRSVRSTTSNSRGPNKSMVKDLFSKALNGRHRQVEEVFARGIPVDTVDEHGNTVLLVAAQNGHKKLIKTALRYGADINAQNVRHLNSFRAFT